MEGLNLDNLTSRFESIGAALLNIEVNTIVKLGMSAQKMPEVPIALHNIAAAYAGFLGRLPPEWLAAVPPGALPPYNADTATNGPDAFDAFAKAADAVVGALGARAALDERGAVLVRIRTNSRQISHKLTTLQGPLNKYGDKLIGGTQDDVSAALAALPAPLPIPPDFVVLIRKMWDIGTEVVMFQSTLQIDGDAVTRMSPALFDPDAGGNPATDVQRGFLSQIHHEALATATAQWRTLFQVVGELMGSLARVVFPKV